MEASIFADLIVQEIIKGIVGLFFSSLMILIEKRANKK